MSRFLTRTVPSVRPGDLTFGDPPVLGTVLADELGSCSPKNLLEKAKERLDGLVCALALIKRTNQAVFDYRPQWRGYRHPSDNPNPRTRFGSQRAEVLVLG
jgi:hypothetical protein